MSQNKREDVIIVCVVNQIYMGLCLLEDIALHSIPSLLARPEALTARANAGYQGHT